jgi:hypothetical protein
VKVPFPAITLETLCARICLNRTTPKSGYRSCSDNFSLLADIDIDHPIVLSPESRSSPARGRYLNVETVIAPSNSELEILSLSVGKVPVPTWTDPHPEFSAVIFLNEPLVDL